MDLLRSETPASSQGARVLQLRASCSTSEKPAVIFWLLYRFLWHSTAHLLLLLVERPLIPTEHGVRAGISLMESSGLSAPVYFTLYGVGSTAVRLQLPARSTRNHYTITAPKRWSHTEYRIRREVSLYPYSQTTEWTLCTPYELGVRNYLQNTL